MNQDYLNELAMNFDPFPVLKALQSQPKQPLGMDPNMMPGIGGQPSGLGYGGPGGVQTAGGIGTVAPNPAAAGSFVPSGGPSGGNMPGAAPLDPKSLMMLQSMMAPKGVAGPGAVAPQRTPPVDLGARTTLGKPGQRPSLAQLLGMR